MIVSNNRSTRRMERQPVGYFGTFLFDGHGWTELAPNTEPTIPEPWLMLDIDDSDIATVSYRPTGPGSGTAYIGLTPRTMYEDDAASAPTDTDREAAGLANWREHLRLVDTHHTRGSATAAELRAYLAEDLAPLVDELDEDDSDDPDIAEVFVEAKVRRFLAALGIPAPEDLPDPEIIRCMTGTTEAE